MGSRRTHNESAVSDSTISHMMGFDGTSNVQAGYSYSVPIMGTSAHAFTLAHENEKEAFLNQIKSLGVSTTLLVDTYDIEQGIKSSSILSSNN